MAKEYFQDSELACPDCDLCTFDPELRRMMNEVREETGIPMIITSACRCAKHNAKVGGAPNSAHLPGPDGLCHAVDIACLSDRYRWQLVFGFIRRGINRIEVTNLHVHVDRAPHLPEDVFIVKWIGAKP